MLSFLLLLMLAQVGNAPETNERDTATIRGRVTDKETGAPLARALVHVSNKHSMRTARTDSDGRFELAGLPPGEYMGTVRPGEHRATHLWQPLRDPRGPLRLKAGEVRDHVNAALPRALAADVRVVDEWGGPLAGIQIRLTDAGTGAYGFGGFHTTDDRGRLRMYGVAPGRYFLCAEPRTLGSSAESDATNRERFLRTCYPSADSEHTADPIQMERGDAGEFQIVMRRGRTLTISGIVLDSTGTPAPHARLSLNRHELHSNSGTGVTIQRGGQFNLTNVHPGDYALTAELNEKYLPEHRGPSEKAYYSLRLRSDAPDIDGLVLAMSRTVDVRGRFLLEDSNLTLPSPLGSGLMVSAPLADDTLPGTASGGHAIAEQDRSFVLEGMFRPRTLDISNVPRGWYVKSILYDGKDVFSTPTEFKGSEPSIDIVLSNRGAVVSGRVLDERGEPVRDVRVLMIPAGKKRWGYHEQMTANTSESGSFRIGPQRAGEYVIIPLPPGTPPPDSRDHERILALAGRGERIRLADREERTLDLYVVKQSSALDSSRGELPGVISVVGTHVREPR